MDQERQIYMSRRLLIIAGIFFVGLGVIGIFLTVLPTTAFLLLAASCFVRSSDRFYNWLINNRYLGKYIKNYREGKGVPVRTKVLGISLLWLTIGYSVLFVVRSNPVRIILILVAVGVTAHILSLRTLDAD